jgi:regulatory protein
MAENGNLYSPQSLYQRAVEYILTMPKTERQVRLWLMRKTADRNEIDAITDKLKEYDFINDANYAQLFADAKKGKMAAGMIRNKLLMNGVKSEIIEKVTADITGQNELAAAMAEKYLRSKPKNPETRSKLFRHLLSKGFDYELSGEVANECWHRHCGG